MLFQVAKPLNSSVLEIAHFGRVVHRPASFEELFVELEDVQRVQKVDECVANVRLIFEVNGQVQEVVLSLVVAVDLGNKVLELVLVRNILDHK